jgi:hypothetical protein
MAGLDEVGCDHVANFLGICIIGPIAEVLLLCRCVEAHGKTDGQKKERSHAVNLRMKAYPVRLVSFAKSADDRCLGAFA